jgi:hypothetical protein
MSEVVLSQIEKSIVELPVDEQLQLISRVAERLRRQNAFVTDFESSLADMAVDEEIQRELRDIERDFRLTEIDGLGE